MSEQSLDEEASQQVFPSFVWLVRDVAAHLPEGVENLKAYFLEKVTVPQKFIVVKGIVLAVGEWNGTVLVRTGRNSYGQICPGGGGGILSAACCRRCCK